LDRSRRREVSREITQKNAEYSDNARGMQIIQINTIIRLVCIEEHMGFKYRSFQRTGGIREEQIQRLGTGSGLGEQGGEVEHKGT